MSYQISTALWISYTFLYYYVHFLYSCCLLNLPWMHKHPPNCKKSYSARNIEKQTRDISSRDARHAVKIRAVSLNDWRCYEYCVGPAQKVRSLFNVCVIHPALIHLWNVRNPTKRSTRHGFFKRHSTYAQLYRNWLSPGYDYRRDVADNLDHIARNVWFYEAIYLARWITLREKLIRPERTRVKGWRSLYSDRVALYGCR